LVLVLLSCSEPYNKVSELESGDIVSFIQGNDYCIAKVIEKDTSTKRGYISIYFYKQRFTKRPDSTDYINLITSTNPEVFGMLNWEIEGFEGMKPQVFYSDIIKCEEIKNDTFINNIKLKIEALSDVYKPQ